MVNGRTVHEENGNVPRYLPSQPNASCAQQYAGEQEYSQGKSQSHVYPSIAYNNMQVITETRQGQGQIDREFGVGCNSHAMYCRLGFFLGVVGEG